MRVFFMVLDSLGIGATPDAKNFDDKGSDTLGHIADRIKEFSLPTLESLGLGIVKPHPHIAPQPSKHVETAVLYPVSASKDTSAGHWEMMGSPILKPFSCFPEGFPEKMMKRFTEETGLEYLANYPASGTEIIEKLGKKHLESRKVIVYTSADSVFQIAAHENVISPRDLYKICEKTRKIADDYNILRVIARPFTGKIGNFRRLNNKRHDYSMKPPSEIYLQKMVKNNIKVISVGKINDIFAGVGISESIHSLGNKDGMKINLKLLDNAPHRSFIFTNFVDFDAIYGHRRNFEGYYEALRDFDSFLPAFIAKMKHDDHLILTADHGCDPTFKGTNHTRENVFFIRHSPSLSASVCHGIKKGFYFSGQKVCSLFNIKC